MYQYPEQLQSWVNLVLDEVTGARSAQRMSL